MTTQIRGIDYKNKKLILQITSAYGFGLIKGFISVHATFMNKQIQNSAVFINNEWKFTSNFIWNLDNATLKKFKMANASIRVECFHTPINESSSNEKLGYLILKLKEAQTIDPSSNDRVENRSYKLIGTKNCSYNFTLSLRIETSETLLEKNKELNLFNNKNINDNDNNFQKVKEKTHFVENIKINLPKNNLLQQTILQKKYEPQNFSISDNVLQGVVEESEHDRIPKQMTSFNGKMKMEEQQLLKEFNNKWLDGKCIEKELIRKMSKCKELTEAVNKMADTLKEREDIVTAKELESARQTDYVENEYVSLMQDLQSSNTQTINELTNRIFELETKLHSLEKENMLLRNENELLKDMYLNNELEYVQLNLENIREETNKTLYILQRKIDG